MNGEISYFAKGLPAANFIRADIGDDLGTQGYLKYQLFGQDLYLTTTHISLFIVCLTLILFAIVANRAVKRADPYEKPGMFVNILEMLVQALDNLVISNMGKKHGPKFANYIGTLACFILLSNISGLMGLRSPTADYGVTLPLALITFIMIQYNGFKYQKLGKVKGWFEPIFFFFPINIIGDLATPVSMSLRLFGNILSGTIMMGLLYGLVPWFLTLAWPAVLHAYLDLFSGAIQTFVFCMLTMVFVTDAISEEE